MFNSLSRSQGFRAGILSACILALVLVLWHLATAPVAAPHYADPEYARLMGGKGQTSSGLPSLPQMGTAIWKHLSNPFYDNGPNDKGVGLQVGYSIGRVLLGFLLAAAVAIPLGFVIGMSPLLFRALNPFIQVLKPISPLAWMPLALYTIKDSTISSILSLIHI